MEALLAKGRSIEEEAYEEVTEDWKERDEQAWAEELRKRERARKSHGVGDNVVKPAVEN